MTHRVKLNMCRSGKDRFPVAAQPHVVYQRILRVPMEMWCVRLDQILSSVKLPQNQLQKCVLRRQRVGSGADRFLMGAQLRVV